VKKSSIVECPVPDGQESQIFYKLVLKHRDKELFQWLCKLIDYSSWVSNGSPPYWEVPEHHVSEVFTHLIENRWSVNDYHEYPGGIKSIDAGIYVSFGLMPNSPKYLVDYAFDKKYKMVEESGGQPYLLSRLRLQHKKIYVLRGWRYEN